MWLTLINISIVKHWFKPEVQPEAVKDFAVLLVFCEEHVKLEWIADDHTWAQDVDITRDDGTTTHYEKGAKTQFLWAYVEQRAKTLDRSVFTRILVWGQKKAWADTQICCFLAQELAVRYGQTMQIFDCLGSRWSPHSMLEHWNNQAIMTPLAPGSTGFMAEPDTHEHAQIKAEIREVKSELHFDLEQECKLQKKPVDKLPWGPSEYVFIVAEAMKRFKTKNPLCPLQGLIENQLLAVRPTRVGAILEPRLLEDCTEASTKDLLNKVGIKRYPPAKGITAQWAKGRDECFKQWAEDSKMMPGHVDSSSSNGSREGYASSGKNPGLQT